MDIKQFEQEVQYPTTIISASRVFVQKDREHEYDSKVNQEWRNARSSFYTEYLPKKLDESKAGNDEKKKLFQVFINYYNEFQNSGFNKLIQTSQKGRRGCYFGGRKNQKETVSLVKQYLNLLEQLRLSLKKLNDQFVTKKKQCIRIQRILQMKIISLKAIHIEYDTRMDEYNQKVYRYSISAFELFKVIHENTLLEEVIFKGVSIQQFPEFIKIINPSNNDQKTKMERESLVWIKHFGLRKSLKLTINAWMEFEVSQKTDINPQINDLTHFIEQFQQLSEVTVKIKLVDWKKMAKWKNKLPLLWKCLQLINKISIQLQETVTYNYIPIHYVSQVRSLVFGGLSSFKTIRKLMFRQFCFQSQTNPQDFLAMQQTIRDLFQNNLVTHLRLRNCIFLPIFPDITTLESIDQESFLFSNREGFMHRVVQSNKNLKSITGQSISQQHRIRISKQLFSQLQNLVISKCNIVLQSGFEFSKIKRFSISDSYDYKIGKIETLLLIFPKFSNLIQLGLFGIDFDDQLLPTIPSPYLEKLQIMFNPLITNEGLKKVDEKWPYLNYLLMYQCGQVTKYVWQLCKFKGLMTLKTQTNLLGQDKQGMEQLLKRGIKMQR